MGWYVPIFYFTSHPLALSLFFEKKLKAASLLRIFSPMSGLGVWDSGLSIIILWRLKILDDFHETINERPRLNG